MKKIIVLGAGRVGKAIASDLSSHDDFYVLVADTSREALAHPRLGECETRILDMSDLSMVRKVCEPCDIVVSAAPSALGYDVIGTLAEMGKPVVDISFFNRDPFDHNEAALESGSVVVTDAGIAPGFSNLLAGHSVREMESVSHFSCFVGGLPVARHWPFQYRAPFAPGDVIEEYLRPARLRVNGEVVVREALTEPEPLDVPGIGTLEAFNTDGLRTLLTTLDIPNMVEKTIRYPGHADLMRALRDTGFLSDSPVEVGGCEVAPLDLSARLLFDAWRLTDDEEEFTVLTATSRGVHKGEQTSFEWLVIDYRDPETGLSSMARTTGYTCTAAVRLLADGKYTDPGIHPLEHLGLDGHYPAIRDYLRNKGISVTESQS